MLSFMTFGSRLPIAAECGCQCSGFRSQAPTPMFVMEYLLHTPLIAHVVTPTPVPCQAFGELRAQIWRHDGWVSAVISSLSMMHGV